MCVLCFVAKSCPTLCDPVDCSRQAPLSMGILQTRILEWLPCSPLRDLPNPGIQHRSSTLQLDSLLSEPPDQFKRGNKWKGRDSISKLKSPSFLDASLSY